MSAGAEVNVVEGQTPTDYHCDCRYCSQVIGELRPPDGSYYSRLERREYYDPSEQGPNGHIAKTPLHVARWAVQEFTEPGDWVLDPTMGAGTTAVEALTQGRNAAGMEIQYGEVLAANVKRHVGASTAKIRMGDAREIGSFLDELGVPFDLVVNNPPYSGDEGDGGMGADHPRKHTLKYKDGLPNLAFLREGQQYWDALGKIYAECARHLNPGGHFVIGVKDMMRQKKPFMLHRDLCELLEGGVGLDFVGTAFLKHHPTTLHLNTYEKRYGVRPPLYQTISVFKKRGD